MIRIGWTDRRPGDVGLTRVPGEMGELISQFELGLLPDAPRDHVPSHALVVGEGHTFQEADGLYQHDDTTVVESWLSDSENSVCAINRTSKYDEFDRQGLVECWRCEDAVADQVERALELYISAYGGSRYGVGNLVGFALEEVVQRFTGHRMSNPIEWSRVCSQGAMSFLQLLAKAGAGSAAWSIEGDAQTLVRNCHPLALRVWFLAHEVRANGDR